MNLAMSVPGGWVPSMVGAGVLRCTRPGVYDARTAMNTLLADLEDDAASASIPAVVSCR